MDIRVKVLCKKDCEVDNVTIKKGELYPAFHFERNGELHMGIYINADKRVQLIFKNNGEFTLFFSEHFEIVI